jgi:hypothetical protein
MIRPAADSVACLDDDSSRPALRAQAGVALMCLVSSLLLYFLMAGPLVWLEGKFRFRPFTRTVQTVYAPLVHVVRSDWEPASTIVKTYVGFFKK